MRHMAARILLPCALLVGAGAASAEKPSKTQELARRVVTQSAGVKPGEVVLVYGLPRDLTLLEDLVIEVERAGGSPILQLGTERIYRESLVGTEAYDGSLRRAAKGMAELIDVRIGLDDTQTEGLLADIPAERLEKRARANEPVNEIFRKRKIRGVFIGNDLYPTPWRAKQQGLAPAALAKSFWDGLAVDGAELKTRGDAVARALVGKDVHLTAPNGTDLRLSTQGTKTWVSDGVVSPEEVAAGQYVTFLPAGEVAVIPTPGTGDGQVVTDEFTFEGKLVKKLTLKLEKGKLVSFTGEGPGFARLKEIYDGGSAGKDELSWLDVGVNTHVAQMKRGNFVAGGSVNLGTGGNAWCGGSNTATAGLGASPTHATLEVDGKVVIENGKLKL